MDKMYEKIIYIIEKLITKKAISESEVEFMVNNKEKIELFIKSYQNKTVANIDDFISPDDEISDHILNYLAEEKAWDETLDAIKEQYRKKKITLSKYLEGVRSISDIQFMCMAQRRKIMSVLAANKR